MAQVVLKKKKKKIFIHLYSTTTNLKAPYYQNHILKNKEQNSDTTFFTKTV